MSGRAGEPERRRWGGGGGVEAGNVVKSFRKEPGSREVFKT